MAADEYIASRFRVISDWCFRSNDYVGGWPNFQEATYDSPNRVVYGHHVMRQPYITGTDVPANELPFQDLRTRFVAAHDYAKRSGYGHGFPNFHAADYGNGTVYGTLLLTKEACYFTDVHARDLGLGEGDPSAHPMDEWFRGASAWAFEKKLTAALPNGNYAHYPDGWRCGVMVVTAGLAEGLDIRGRELGLRDLLERTPDYLGKSGWIGDNLPSDEAGNPTIKPTDIDLVVRSYNVCHFDMAKSKGMVPDYEPRVSGAVERFLADWDLQLGFIGLQEADEKARVANTESTIAGLLATRMDHWFSPTGHDTREELGFVWSEREWSAIGGSKVWMIGRRRLNWIRWAKHFLMGTKLVHREKGWMISVYNTHLAPGDQVDRREARTRQIRNSLEIIDSDVGPGELPPLLLGDMNFDPTESENYELINSRFQLCNELALGSLGGGEPSAVGIDHVWIGRTSHFSGTVGSAVPVRWHTSGGSTYGIDLAGLSDHASPAVSFRLVGAQPHPAARTDAIDRRSRKPPAPVVENLTPRKPWEGGPYRPNPR